MGRKKRNNNSNKPQIINNIGSVNMEIDYEKLAEAIVKANEKLLQKDEQDAGNINDSFGKNLLKVIKGEPLSNSATALTMSKFISDILNCTVAVCVIIFILSLVSVIYCAVSMFDWSSINIIPNILAIVVFVSFMFVLISYSVIIKAMANEIKYEKDKNYIVSLFSSLIGVVALIVAIVALLKGVG